MYAEVFFFEVKTFPVAIELLNSHPIIVSWLLQIEMMIFMFNYHEEGGGEYGSSGYTIINSSQCRRIMINFKPGCHK